MSSGPYAPAEQRDEEAIMSGQVRCIVQATTHTGPDDPTGRTFRHPQSPAITVQALRPGDEAPVQAVFDGMSAKSRLMRYLVATPTLSRGARRRLAEVDHRTRGAWVARDADVVVGIARYALVALENGVESAEIALEVVDTHHGRGVGGFLIDVLATVLEELGIDRWHWSGHPSNSAMRRLAARSGATWRYDNGEVIAHARVSTVRPRQVRCGTPPEVLAQSRAWA